MFKQFVLVFHFTFHILYYYKIENNLLIFASLFFHILCLINKPQCYQNHCHTSQADTFPQIIPEKSLSESNYDIQSEKDDKPKKIKQMYVLENCAYCKLTKWIRMHHCHRCKVCIHKYDHHCVLLGLCVGERNQKYYIGFLWAYLYACIRQTVSYFSLIDKHIEMDWQTGIEKTDWTYSLLMIAVIFYFLVTILMLYLTILHAHLIIYNETTYQKNKKVGIWYFRRVQHLDHPFDEGLLTNLKLIFWRAGSKPIEWWNPSAGETYQTYLQKIQQQKSQTKK